MTRIARQLRLALAFLLAGSFAVQAEVVRIEIVSRTDVASGRSFGLAGAYELIIARVHYAVDPANPENRKIIDLALAPRGPDGKVHFSGNLYVMKPKNMSLGNGAIVYQVPNRGGRGIPFRSRWANVPDVGDDFLMRHGFTVVWSGWQFDIPDEGERMRLTVPVATQNGKAIEGLVRTDFVVAERMLYRSLGDRYMIPFPAIAPNGKESILTVREAENGPRRTVPRNKWRFARVADGKVVDDPGFVYLEGGFEPGLIYEVVWRSHNPGVSGLGFASVRDLISHFKYGRDSLVRVERAYSFGTSQSGRFLREYIYQGWNADERDRKVFDGIMPNVAATGNFGMNLRFAQPSRGAHPFLIAFMTPTNIFPFTDVEQLDPQTGERDGILKVYNGRPHVMPKVFYFNASNEYWGRAAALTHVTVDGRSDVPVPDNVRIYLYSGSQHGAAPFPPERVPGPGAGKGPTALSAGAGVHRNNPNDYTWSHRALLIAMDRWVRDGTAPPPSQYPRVADATLVPLAGLKFPAIPGVTVAKSLPLSYRMDFGPRFRSQGIVDHEPPKVGAAVPLLLPQVDTDGNEMAGIRLPDIAVPLATYTGWNLRAPDTGAPTELAGLAGSYIPFPRTRAEASQRNDPRKAIEERYQGVDHYVGLYAGAALKLIKEGYLLAEDLPDMLAHARKHWEWVMTTRPE